VERLVRPFRLEDLSGGLLKTCPATTSSIATIPPTLDPELGGRTAMFTWSRIVD
jgi:hypothetical protein